MSHFQSQLRSEYESAESIADSLASSPLYLQNREDYEFSRMPIATVKPAAMLPERGASAKRLQADQSRRVSLISSSSQEPSAPGKLAAMSSSGNEEPRYQLKSSNVKNADPSIVGRSLLEGNKKSFAQSSKM